MSKNTQTKEAPLQAVEATPDAKMQSIISQLMFQLANLDLQENDLSCKLSQVQKDKAQLRYELQGLGAAQGIYNPQPEKGLKGLV